jgi:hypothetical protein
MTADPVLHALARPAGSRAVPARFDEAAALFARAEAAYGRGDRRTATTLFLRAALVLRMDIVHAEDFAAARTVSYWNAILAAVAAGDCAGADRVVAIARDDPRCWPPVEQLLRRLPPADMSTSD